MASRAVQPTPAETAAQWLAAYCGDRPHGDVLCTAQGDDRDAER